MDTCCRHGEERLSRMTDFYITLKNSDSVRFFPANKPSHFRVKLHERLKVGGHWKVALCEIHTTERIPVSVYACSNLTSSYIAGGSLTPALRYIPCTSGHAANSHVFDTPYYISIDGHEYDTIEIYITDELFNITSLMTKHLTCTLHFKQV